MLNFVSLLDTVIGRDGQLAWPEARRRALVWARHMGAAPADAEDIAQEAILRAWRERASLECSEAFPGWLATIVRNEALRFHGRRREWASLGDWDCADDDLALAAVGNRSELAAALEALSAHERRLLALRYEHDMTQAAIAAELGIPEGTVKVQLHRAREKLRAALAGV